jgi:hypothetical protein
LLTGDSLCEALRRNGRETVERAFSILQTMDRIEAVLQRVVKRAL